MAEGEFFSTILRLTLALAAGGLVRLERSFHGRPAGFREHTLVCISACMLMLLADYHVARAAAAGHTDAFLDPTRMAQGIMTGIGGFLGAGAIVKEGFAIRGLTTAASIWMISAIGIMIGMGYYLAAGAATFATFTIN
jgi:putative Mg2+ transporter-C (MgtC) family protein